MIGVIIIAAGVVAIIVALFINVKINDRKQIDLLVQSVAAKDDSISNADERLKSVMKKMAELDKENKQLLNVVNMLLTVSPRYVLQAFADKKLFDLVQKQIIVEKQVPYNLDVKYVADRYVDRLAS